MGDDKQKRLLASEIFTKAWHEAHEAQIDPDLVSSTALTLALSSLVKTSGKDNTIRIAKRLIGAIEDGRFAE